jgi:hypothetical protein
MDMYDKADEQSIADRSQPKGWKKVGRLAFRGLLIVGVFIVIWIVGQSLLSSFSLQDLMEFRQKIEQIDNFLIIIRLGLIALLILYWHPFNAWLANVNGWSNDHLVRVLAGRWWALSVLLFVELFLVQRVYEILY